MRAWYSQILIVMISNKYNENKKTLKLLSSFLFLLIFIIENLENYKLLSAVHDEKK